MADMWSKIRKEYIAGASQRALARKYHVSARTVKKHAEAEEWDHGRQQAGIKATALAAKQVVKDAELLHGYGATLMEKAIEGMQATEAGDWQALKAYAQIGRDIRLIMDVKSDSDMAEQAARIAELRQRSEAGKAESSSLIVKGLPEEFKR